MPLICIQCSMEALLAGKEPPTFDETAETHRFRCHRDPVATQERRDELNRRWAKKFEEENPDD